MDGWKAELVKLAEISHVQPHLAFCALTQGLVSCWTYLSRTVKDIHALLQPSEEILQKDVLPKLTGRSAPDKVVRALFALPARLGGIDIPIPSEKEAIRFRVKPQDQLCGSFWTRTPRRSPTILMNP